MTKCGTKHTLALDNDGNIWYWGSKSSVGIDDVKHEHQKTPALLIKSSSKTRFVNISVRQNLNHAITVKGQIIEFGEDRGKSNENMFEDSLDEDQIVSINNILLNNLTYSLSTKIVAEDTDTSNQKARSKLFM